MSEDVHVHGPECGRRSGASSGGMCGGVYGLAFLGSLIYYIQQATGFWDGVLGVLKAIVWPAFLVYKVMEFLKM